MSLFNLSLLRIIRFIFVINLVKITKDFLKIKSLINFIFTYKESFYPLATANFEDKLKKLSGKNYVITTCNGSMAIESAVYGCELVNKNIGCAINMIPSSYYPAKVLGNKIIPIKIDKESLCICINSLRELCEEKKIDGLIFCDFYGNYSLINEVREICNQYQIFLIRDCSHSHHYILDKEKSGGPNEIICYSFQSAKGISSFEGGALCIDSPEICKKALFYTSQDKFLIKCEQNGLSTESTNFDPNGFGKKGRINPLGSVVALVDLNFIKIQNWYMKEFITIANLFKKKSFKKIKIFGTNMTFFSCGCNTLLLLANNKKEAFDIKKSLEKNGIYSYFRKYSLNYQFNKNDYNKLVIDQSNEIFEKILFVSITNFTSHKRLIFIIIKSFFRIL